MVTETLCEIFLLNLKNSDCISPVAKEDAEAAKLVYDTAQPRADDCRFADTVRA